MHGHVVVFRMLVIAIGEAGGTTVVEAALEFIDGLHFIVKSVEVNWTLFHLNALFASVACRDIYDLLPFRRGSDAVDVLSNKAILRKCWNEVLLLLCQPRMGSESMVWGWRHFLRKYKLHFSMGLKSSICSNSSWNF